MADAAAPKKKNIFKRFIPYLKELRSETKKIVWPSKGQVLNNTIVVIVMIVVIGAFIAVIDSLLGLGMFAIFGR
ncbi:MAG: preprotein translocase subunit SecE [Clostridia bacterium]|nr:preprotein translocase subunit SecE [Clostridia bacterium]